MKAKILPISLTLVVGAIGFMIGRSGQSNQTTTTSSVEGSSLSARSSSEVGGSSAETSKRSSSSRAGTTERKSSGGTTADPLVRLAEMKTINDPLEKARMWLQFVDSLSEEQFLGVMEAFRADGVSPEEMGDYAILLTAWAKANPIAALEYAGKATSNPFARQTILASWASIDPNSAIAWAKENHKGEGANPWMVGVIKGLAFQDPSLASSLLTEMPRSGERGQALDHLLPSLLQQGVQQTRDWVASLTDPALKEGAMMRVAERTMEQDPLGTADWLIANPTEATNRRVDDALYTMAKKDLFAAMDYFNELPAGDVRSNAFRGIVNATATEDPQKAVAMMDAHSSDVNNRVVEQFVWHSFRNNPELAVTNISRLTDTNQRDQMYNRTLEWWMERDQQAALNWVGNNALPQNVTDRLNRIIERQQQRDN